MVIGGYNGYNGMYHNKRRKRTSSILTDSRAHNTPFRVRTAGSRLWWVSGGVLVSTRVFGAQKHQASLLHQYRPITTRITARLPLLYHSLPLPTDAPFTYRTRVERGRVLGRRSAPRSNKCLLALILIKVTGGAGKVVEHLLVIRGWTKVSETRALHVLNPSLEVASFRAVRCTWTQPVVITNGCRGTIPCWKPY